MEAAADDAGLDLMSPAAGVDHLQLVLELEEAPILVLDLVADGAIKRMGSGSEDSVDKRNMYVGRVGSEVAARVLESVRPEILARPGRFVLPDPAGARCVLTVRTSGESGDFVAVFEYGSESPGPPDAICNLVEVAVMETDAWFAEQVAGATKR